MTYKLVNQQSWFERFRQQRRH